MDAQWIIEIRGPVGMGRRLASFPVSSSPWRDDGRHRIRSNRLRRHSQSSRLEERRTTLRTALSFVSSTDADSAGRRNPGRPEVRLNGALRSQYFHLDAQVRSDRSTSMDASGGAPPHRGLQPRLTLPATSAIDHLVACLFKDLRHSGPLRRAGGSGASAGTTISPASSNRPPLELLMNDARRSTSGQADGLLFLGRRDPRGRADVLQNQKHRGSPRPDRTKPACTDLR
jgi:hypothetical protein